MKTMTAVLALAVVPCVFVVAAAVEKNITVTDTREVPISDAETQVDVASGGVGTISPSPYAPTVRAQAGGMVKFDNPGPVYDDETVTNAPWASKVGLWLDGSLVSSFNYYDTTLYTPSGVEGTSAGKTSRIIDRWFDRRDADHTMEWRGYNNRNLSSVMPYVVTQGDYLPNGKTYVSLGKAATYVCRLPFIQVVDGVENAGNQGVPPPAAMPSKYVLMVFGSQNNGGRAIIADSMGRYQNAADQTNPAVTEPIFNSYRETRLNGESVNPTQKNLLNGGWQIIGFEVNNNVKGLGWCGWGTMYGGQNYAEVMVFTNAPTAKEIVDAELYLANKWGVTVTAPSNAARLYGSGAAELTGGTLTLGGGFAGMLTLAAGTTLKLGDTQCAPSAPAAGAALWYDPDGPETDYTLHEAGDTTYPDMFNFLANKIAERSWWKLAGGGRSPYIERKDDESRLPHGWGPVRTWLDYRTKRPSIKNGTQARFGSSTASDGNLVQTKACFMILDSSHGGGQPVVDTSVYDEKMVVAKPRVNVSDPILIARGEGHEFVTNSPCYLNGVAVDAGSHAFNSRAELLTLTFPETAFPLKGFGYWMGGSEANYLIQGETIVYENTLSDADRKDTEAYLMSKWLGITPAGYGDPSAMTIAGSGTVKLANHATAKPQFAAAFAGTVGAAAGELSFTVTAGTEAAVADPLALGGGTFDAGEALAVNIKLDGRVTPGRYLLIDAAAWTGAEPTLGTVEKTVKSRRTCTLVREGGKLYVNVERPGLAIVVR